jgi:hypothetical protein
MIVSARFWNRHGITLYKLSIQQEAANWSIGTEIVLEDQSGSKRAKYGSRMPSFFSSLPLQESKRPAKTIIDEKHLLIKMIESFLDYLARIPASPQVNPEPRFPQRFGPGLFGYSEVCVTGLCAKLSLAFVEVERTRVALS